MAATSDGPVREITVPKTVPELMAQIVDMSGEDVSKLPVGKGFCWFGMYDQNQKLGPPVTFRVGDRSPFNKRMGVVALFQNDAEVRVYAIPLEKPEKNEEVAFTRHTLSKTAPTFFWEALPPDVFQAEIASELIVLGEQTADPTLQDDEEEEEQEHQQEPGSGVTESGPVPEETRPPAT
jgi:hypothetical protein